MFDVTDESISSTFQPVNPVGLVKRGDHKQIWAYTNQFKGKNYVHVREVWRKDETHPWAPGSSGISFEATNEDVLGFVTGIAEALPIAHIAQPAAAVAKKAVAKAPSRKLRASR